MLSFTGERDSELRILRAFKNRFGTTSEIGAFRMEEEGLVEIDDLSDSFVENSDSKPEGSVITAVYEGSRPVMFEIQALTAPSNVGFARRSAVGIESARLNMILAVLEKKVGLTLMNQDVYVNVVGGMKPDSTAVDLAVSLAIYSSLRNIRISKRILAIGEVGLTGELRGVQNIEKIVSEAARLGYEHVIMPQKNALSLNDKSFPGCEVCGVRNLQDAISLYKSFQ